MYIGLILYIFIILSNIFFAFMILAFPYADFFSISGKSAYEDLQNIKILYTIVYILLFSLYLYDSYSRIWSRMTRSHDSRDHISF